jgi:hypothetical protein
MVTVVVTQPGATVPGDGGGEASGTVGIPCAWDPEPADPATADELNATITTIYDVVNRFLPVDLEIPLTYYSEHGTLRAWSWLRDRFEQRMIADCTDATDPDGWFTGAIDWWVVEPPNPEILLPGLILRVTQPLATPGADISPVGEAPINVGLWLATQPAGPIRVRATLGPIWAEVTAEVTTTTFDVGDGAPIVCDGFGTPIPESERDSIEAGPCGHTFTDLDDVGDTTFTITSNWSVAWQTSAGTSGSEPAVLTSATIPYEVYEIQTVGTRG